MADQKKNVTKNNGKKKAPRKATLFEDRNKFGEVKYTMSKESAWCILHDPVTGKKIPGDDQKLLCDHVNEQMGLLNYCVEVVVG